MDNEKVSNIDFLKIAQDALTANARFASIDKRLVQKGPKTKLALEVAFWLLSNRDIVKEDITKHLIRNGMEPEEASTLVTNVKEAIDNVRNSPQGQEMIVSAQNRNAVQNRMITGGIVFVLSLIAIFFLFGSDVYSLPGFFKGLAIAGAFAGLVTLISGLAVWLTIRK